MDQRVIELTEALSKRSGASEASLNEFMAATGVHLPAQYLEYMKMSNGGEGYVGQSSYLALFPIEKIMPINKAAATEEFAPGLLIFANNGMGTSYAFDTRDSKMTIIEVDDMELSFEAAVPRGGTFVEFLEYLFTAM